MATSLRLSNLPPIFSRTPLEFNRPRRNPNLVMASALPVEQREEKEAKTEKIKGDSFIRHHLRKLLPYQPILPFEVCRVIIPAGTGTDHSLDCFAVAFTQSEYLQAGTGTDHSLDCFAVAFTQSEYLQAGTLLLVLSTRLGRKPEDIIKLDANENPYGPPPEVLEALGNIKFPYVYPDPESRRLREALAEDSGLESEYILAGCGADELIDLIMRCVLDPDDKIIDCPPTFTMYEFDAAVNGAQVIKVPRLPDFSLDVTRIIEAVRQEKPKCIFLTSPNNPDGSIINDEDLLQILDLPILVVLDEAYIEFSGIKSKMDWVKKHDNLIVLRTFSKRAGLAGLRVGYGAFPKSIIEYLWRAKQPYNVSVAAEIAACAALQNPTYLERVKNLLVQERERLFTLLKGVPFLNPFPSYSNFILCEVTEGKDPKKIKEDLAKMGVMIRHYNKKELMGYIRISVGKPEHTDVLMRCLNLLQ